MPIQFPSNPQTNQEYTYEGKVWAWDGVSWVGVRQETGGVKKQNIWAKQNLLIPKRSTGLNSGYSGVTDQRRTRAGTIPALKHYMERDLGFFGSNLWTPADITTSLWLDAADASTITLNGSNVSQWNDKSGNARHATQSTAGLQPLYGSTVINSKPALRFASEGGAAQDSLTASISVTQNTLSVYTVFQKTGSSGNSKHRYGRIVSFWNTNDNSNNPADYGNSNGFIAAFIGQQDTFSSVAAPNIVSFRNGASITAQSLAYQNGGRIIGTILSGSSVSFRLDGNETTGTTTVTAMNSNQMLIGSSPAGSDSEMSGDISEVVVFLSALTTADSQRMEGYLAHKWGLTANLPANHPYKNAAP